MGNLLDLLLGLDIQADGVPLTRRKALNLAAGLSATDDPTNDRINVEVDGGEGGVGPPGPPGPPGVDGATGAAGATGGVWRNGAGVPSNALGVNGDYYVDTTSTPGNVYFKAAGAYTLALNIRGPTGATGTAGSPAAATPLATVAPVNVTKAAAVIGVSAEAAKADHKHDATTAVPVAIGSAIQEGTSTALSRADHGHTLPPSIAQAAIGAITTPLFVNSQLISNVLNPATAQDAATKAYVDATLPNANVYSASGTWADASFHNILTIDLGVFGDNRSFHCDVFALYFETAGTLYAGSVSIVIGLQRRAGTVTVKGTLQGPTSASSAAAAGVAGTADAGTPPKIQGAITGNTLLVQVQNALGGGVNTNWYAVAKVTHQ